MNQNLIGVSDWKHDEFIARLLDNFTRDRGHSM